MKRYNMRLVEGPELPEELQDEFEDGGYTEFKAVDAYIKFLDLVLRFYPTKYVNEDGSIELGEILYDDDLEQIPGEWLMGEVREEMENYFADITGWPSVGPEPQSFFRLSFFRAEEEYTDSEIESMKEVLKDMWDEEQWEEEME